MPLALYGAQAAVEKRLCNRDLRCEQRRQGSFPDDKSSVPHSSNTAVKTGYTLVERQGDVIHPELEGGGIPRYTVAEKGGPLWLLYTADQQQLCPTTI
jgi:hypothetical protein